jgi:magnesium chelatase family protein
LLLNTLMLIQSFVKTDFGFRPVTVEVVLVPGLSQIQILGLADQVIKESSKRIISALRHQGFRLPPGKQALVNLHPNDLKKSGQGLDLPIALGILLESEQIEIHDFDFKEDYCYGSLTLKGEVQVPGDLNLLNFENFQKRLMTGRGTQVWRFDVEEVTELGSVADRGYRAQNTKAFACQPMKFNGDIQFDPQLGRLMSLVAVGEHPLLVAGFAGGGKTTLVENLATILNLPDEKHFLEAQKYWMLSGRDLRMRPIVQPHHSATPASMIGGGRPLKFGEISLAHGGALILDELLEFHPLVQSALREPMEKGVIYLSRMGARQVFPADSLVLATTNLCPCGNFKPGATYACRCSSLKLRSYIEKLTGPFLDRFAIFHIFEKPKLDLKISLQEIKNQVEQACVFQKESRRQTKVNQKLSIDELIKQLGRGVDESFIPHSKSYRRRQSLLRVARSLADIETSEKIEQWHLEEAQGWTSRDIYKLERFRMEDFAH